MQFHTVLIDLDKWFSLFHAEIALKLPSFYIIAFTDGIYQVRIGNLPVRNYTVTFKGRVDRPEAFNDLSPVIDVPSEAFSFVVDSDGVFED